MLPLPPENETRPEERRPPEATPGGTEKTEQG